MIYRSATDSGGRIARMLIYRVYAWTQKNCFKFSLTKTKAMQFTSLPGIHMQPELRLGNTLIPYADNVKSLALIWDSKLTWKGHITKV